MALRKDLERNAAAMIKIKNPQQPIPKMETLGAKRIYTKETSGGEGNRKDYFLQTATSDNWKQNQQRFQEGALGDKEELRGYVREVRQSNEPMLRNPGDRAVRNKKLNKKFDRGY